MPVTFTPAHRGGHGSPMVCLHGFTDTWRTWELVLPALAERHDVLAPTLPGHAGGPPLEPDLTDEALVDAVEAQLDRAGIDTAHLVGNSLGGYLALRLAARGRARTVVALAPAGGWAEGDESFKDTLGYFAKLYELVQQAAPHADQIVASPEGRRRATEATATHYEHIPAGLLAHQIRGAAACDGTLPLIEHARRYGYTLEAERVTCPVRIVWGTADKILPWPSAAVRYTDSWLPTAEVVELDGIGHCPQLDAPLQAAQLILGFTAG